MKWDIPLDKSSDPLYRQLSEGLAKLIATGKLAPDTKLPPIRQMARALGVINTTVVSAYKDLEHKAVVYSVAGSGTYVAQRMQATMPPIQLPPDIAGDYINFASTTTEAALFPVAAFKRAFNTVMERDGAVAFGYDDGHGYAPLRESISHLMSGVGVTAPPDYVHIISNTEQGQRMLANAVIAPGDAIFVEYPAPQGAVAVFKAARAKIIEMPMTHSGPDFNALESLLKRYRPKLFYITPSFRPPMGTCCSTESRQHLLKLAHTHNAYIIEEDQLSDFYYDGNKRPPLKALDSEGKVIYIKNFSRVLAPGLGLGFMVCPGNMPGLKPSTDTMPPGYTQRAFDIFLRSGGYESHVAHMREVYGRRYQGILAAMRTYLTPFADFSTPGGGLSLWVTPHIANDYTDKFLQRKVVVTPGQLYDANMPGFRISFASVPEERIAEGIGIIASVMQHL